MEIKVLDCSSCPFCVTEYDSECVGFDTIQYCNLTRFLYYNKIKNLEDEEKDNIKHSETHIAAFDSYDSGVECDYCANFDYSDSENYDETQCKCKELSDAIVPIDYTPIWCPIRNGEEFNINNK